MNTLKIKKIELLGKKLGLKEKPIVTDKNILFVSGFLGLNDFKTHISDGLVNKKDFLSPCIVLELQDKPKIRFKNQILFFKKYLAEVKKKSIKQLEGKQYAELITLARKKGETKEYLKWRKNQILKTIWLKNLLKQYNKTRKSLNKKEQLSILDFEDGTIRLDFGNQTNENLRKNIEKLSLTSKKEKLNQFLNEFKKLKEYLINY